MTKFAIWALLDPSEPTRRGLVATTPPRGSRPGPIWPPCRHNTNAPAEMSIHVDDGYALVFRHGPATGFVRQAPAEATGTVRAGRLPETGGHISDRSSCRHRTPSVAKDRPCHNSGIALSRPSERADVRILAVPSSPPPSSPSLSPSRATSDPERVEGPTSSVERLAVR